MIRPHFALECRNLSLQRNQRLLLNQVNLQLAEGETLGLAGLNGAGKTTLLKAALDILSVQCGEILWYGQSHQDPQSRQHLVFFPEQSSLPDYLTGRDFLHLMLRFYQRPRVADEIEAACLTLDFQPDLLSTKIRTYSKGTQQKLGLISCFLSGRQVFVLDEPMSGLDPKARLLLKQALQGWKTAGGTLLFTAHSLEDVISLCDRMLILEQGQVYFTGTPQAFLEYYQSDSPEKAFLSCLENPCLKC